MHYETVAAADHDLEQVSSRLALIDRLAELLRQTPDELLPRVVYRCLGEMRPRSPVSRSAWRQAGHPGPTDATTVQKEC